MDTLIPDLPGFDSAAALKLLGNNAKLYVNVLKRFQAQYSSSYEGLADTILHGENWDDIQREAHTIKGLAGTIGHPGLQQAARDLELTIKDKPSVDAAEVRARGKEFLELFSVVLCQLGAAFPE